jgi:hypothetical protein
MAFVRKRKVRQAYLAVGNAKPASVGTSVPHPECLIIAPPYLCDFKSKASACASQQRTTIPDQAAARQCIGRLLVCVLWHDAVWLRASLAHLLLPRGRAATAFAQARKESTMVGSWRCF